MVSTVEPVEGSVVEVYPPLVWRGPAQKTGAEAAQNDQKKELRFYGGVETMSTGIMSQKQAFETNPGLG